jgi:hypothetical protein
MAYAVVVVHDGGQELDQDIGMGDAGFGAQQGAGFNVVGRAGSLVGGEPLRADHQLAVRPQVLADRDRLVDLELHVDQRVVVHVLADAGQVDPAVDADLLEMFGRADARQHEQLR